MTWAHIQWRGYLPGLFSSAAAGSSRRRVRQRAAVGICGDDNGTALAEFALSAITLIMMSFAVFEFCMLLYTYAILGNAAREGVRYAVVHGTDSSNCSGPTSGCGDSTGANVTAVVNGYASGSLHDISAITINPTWPDGSSQPGSRVKINITYTYIPYINIPGGVTPQMSLTAEGRIVF